MVSLSVLGNERERTSGTSENALSRTCVPLRRITSALRSPAIRLVNGIAQRPGRAGSGRRAQPVDRAVRGRVQATNEAIAHLQACGVLRQTTIGKRNRGFEAPDLIDAFAALERQLASPEAGARVSPSARSVPARRR